MTETPKSGPFEAGEVILGNQERIRAVLNTPETQAEQSLGAKLTGKREAVSVVGAQLSTQEAAAPISVPEVLPPKPFWYHRGERLRNVGLGALLTAAFTWTSAVIVNQMAIPVFVLTGAIFSAPAVIAGVVGIAALLTAGYVLWQGYKLIRNI